MCGIIGYRGDGDAGRVVLEGMENLEYRGYDSSGVVIVEDGDLHLRKESGEIDVLKEKNDLKKGGEAGIGHTRWATHGGVTKENAHPHTSCDGRVSIVHNGIIENHEDLRRDLEGHDFSSETDSEVAAHFLEDRLSRGRDFREAVEDFMRVSEGALAVVAMDNESGELYGMRRGSPLAVGYSEDEYFVGSDAHAFSQYTRKAVFLEDGEYVVLQGGEPEFYRAGEGRVEKRPRELSEEQLEEGKQGYDHYMEKEIKEQPETVKRLENSLRTEQESDLHELVDMVEDSSRVIFTAAGTSYHASLLGVYFLQRAGIEAQTLIASEFQNYERVDEDTTVIAVSQSGETRDTLDAVEFSREKGADIAAVVNTPHSSLERESDAALNIQAGNEKAVAATKTFTNTVLTLLEVASELGYDAERGDTAERLRRTIEENEPVVRELAEELSDEDDMYVIGRGSTYPVAREIALKLKEIPYVHAEGMMGGELKHGTLALIEEGTPVFALMPKEDSEIASNISEIEARGGEVFKISPHKGRFEVPNGTDSFPLFATTVGFLMAYHLGRERGTSIDKPRNLAKTVTVR
ncbi:MAG: glutamine--fructose-6-phosphate transaminase (isomerizing) [Candidatus Nanohaloarchaea archaeon]|nr:glutamine--fructose-6-phosphate transaminase (isomerizing) [Candidatus Nanohaloarchaea archaeon]